MTLTTLIKRAARNHVLEERGVKDRIDIANEQQRRMVQGEKEEKTTFFNNHISNHILVFYVQDLP